MVKPDKSRYVWLYLPSKAYKERWQALADRAKTRLSPFCISIIEEKLAEEEEFRPRRELAKEMEGLKAEVKVLREDLARKNVVLEKYEAELKKHRSQAFLEENYQGTRRYFRELVEVFKARGQLDSYKILESLGIDPRESELVKAVSKQLEELEGYGMIAATPKGWKWIA